MNQRYFLVTGGAGFIGSHLVEHLLNSGSDVLVLDNFSTGSWDNLHAAMHRGCQVIDADASEALARVDTEKLSGIFHLAATVGVSRVLEDSAEMIRNNLRSSEAAIETALKARCPLLMASSSEVYGPTSTPDSLRESDALKLGPPDEPRWAYALTKAIDEQLAMATHRSQGLDVRVVRFFNTIGPRQVGDYGMVLPRMVRAAIDGEPLIVYGDGTQTRCFCDVADVVAGLADLMVAPGANGQVINIGNNQPVSIEALAECVLQVTGSSSPVQRVSYEACPQRRGEPLQRLPCLKKLCGLVPWQPRYTLPESIKRVEKWMCYPGEGVSNS